MRNGLTVFILLFFLSCKKDGNDPVIPAEPLYYPPVNSNTWETVTPASLGWNETALSNVYDYLQQKNTKAFIILYNGKLVVEKYFGTFTADSNWYWASAGKTATALLVGIAQQESLLNIQDKSAQYLGTPCRV